MDDYQRFTEILYSFNRNFQTTKREWIEKSIIQLFELTKKVDPRLNLLIAHSDAFSTLCSNFQTVYTLSILRISLNLTVNNPSIVHFLINCNLLYTIFENLKSFDDQINLTCLKLINNLINSSLFSRICLISGGFFKYALDFLMSPNKLNNIHYIGKLVEYLISCFFNPPNSNDASQKLVLNDPKQIEGLLQQTQSQLTSNSHNLPINIDLAMKLLNNQKGLDLDIPFLWDLLTCLIKKPDSYLINCGLVSFRKFSQNIENIPFIFSNTSLFDQCRDICSRNNPKCIENLFCLFSKFFYVLGEDANLEFIRNGLFSVVIQYFTYPDENVRIAAMRCLSNCIVYDKNTNLIYQSFTNDFVGHLIEASADDKIRFYEKDEIIWILVNLAEKIPEIRDTLFLSKKNMDMMIDFLNMTSKDTSVLILDILDKLFETSGKTHSSTFSLFLQSNGPEAVEDLLDSQVVYIAQSAQYFYDKYLKKM